MSNKISILIAILNIFPNVAVDSILRMDCEENGIISVFRPFTDVSLGKMTLRGHLLQSKQPFSVDL